MSNKLNLEQSEILYKEIQKKSDISLSTEDEMFFCTNHSDGNISKGYVFIPVTGMRITTGFKLLKFEEMLKYVTYHKLECKHCAFRKTIARNEYGCSLLQNYTVRNLRQLEDFVQYGCPLREYRKLNPHPLNFKEIE